VAEKAIQDLKNMMRCFIADSNVPAIYWDFIVEHTSLVNSMTYPSICDPEKKIFEAAWGVVVTIEDSSDDEEVDNLMQDVESLSRVPPFNILEPEAQRNDVSLHVPREATKFKMLTDSDLASSPQPRRSSRRRRSSLSDNIDES